LEALFLAWVSAYLATSVNKKIEKVNKSEALSRYLLSRLTAFFSEIAPFSASEA
jgi:hypothetical protein